MRRPHRVSRWGVVLVGVLILVSVPWALGRFPVAAARASPTTLLARIEASDAVGYSGFAQSTGALALPVTTQFTSLTDLFGGGTTMRVWWRAADDFRVDTVTLNGENDLYSDAVGQWTWDYESDTATRTNGPVEARLPRSADLLPPELGLRLLSEAHPDEVANLASQRIAGIDALGLRLTPSEPGATIGRVDVWADPTTGLPLRVAVYGQGGSAVLTTSFLDVSAKTPARSTTDFTPPPGSKIHQQDQLDIASTIDRLARSRPPATVGGMARNDLSPNLGAVGVYGRGPTEVAVLPLPRRDVGSLRTQLAKAPGVVTAADGTLSTSIGPLSMVVTAPGTFGAAWLLTGTVTVDTLVAAAADLPPAIIFRR